MTELQRFKQWQKTHKPDKEAYWYMQNMLEDVFGLDHPVTKAANKAWSKLSFPPEMEDCLGPENLLQ